MFSFDDIVGHEKVIEHLCGSISMRKISHAYIFVGDDGAGKRMMAMTWAKTLQCEAKGTEPCGSCKSCIQTDSGNQPDIIVTTKSKVNYTIEDIRTQVTNDVQVKPYAGPYKIYIIPDAHTLREDAQNALLKTIEEPPEYAIIILLVDNIDSLLPTILSRCVTINFRPIDKERVKQYVMKECQIPDYAAEVSAVFSQGNIGRALMYAGNEEFTELKNTAVRIAKSFDKTDVSHIMDKVTDIAELKERINDFIDMLNLWFRDMLIIKATKDINSIIFKEESKTLMEQADKRSYQDIEEAIEAMKKAKARLKANVYTEVVLEMMLLQCCHHSN